LPILIFHQIDIHLLCTVIGDDLLDEYDIESYWLGIERAEDGELYWDNGLHLPTLSGELDVDYDYSYVYDSMVCMTIKNNVLTSAPCDASAQHAACLIPENDVTLI
jgi:hypothetical protein